LLQIRLFEALSTKWRHSRSYQSRFTFKNWILPELVRLEKSFLTHSLIFYFFWFTSILL